MFRSKHSVSRDHDHPTDISCRPIFRAMLTVKQFDSKGATITFKDETLETGSVVGLSLHYIDKRQVDDNRGPIRVVSVLKFSGKWQIACIPKLVQVWIQTLADHTQTPERALLCSPIAMLLGFPALSSQLYDTGKTRDENRRGDKEEYCGELEKWLRECRDAIPDPRKPAEVKAHKLAPLGALGHCHFSTLPPQWVWCLLMNIGVKRCDFSKDKFEAMAAQMCESSIHNFHRSVIRLLTCFQIPLSILPSEFEGWRYIG